MPNFPKFATKSGKIIVDVKVVSSKIAQIAKNYLGCFCNKIYYQEVKKSLKMVTLLPTKMNSSKCKIKGPILQRNFHTKFMLQSISSILIGCSKTVHQLECSKPPMHDFMQKFLFMGPGSAYLSSLMAF